MRYTKSKNALKRAIAVTLLVCFIIVFLFSEAFVLLHSDHNHDHDGIGDICAVCVQISSFENMLKQLSLSVGGIIFTLINLFVVLIILGCAASLTKSQTLVKLKIQMNN